MAIFEFFKKNAADWWQKWSEIRIFDIGKFALKFQMLTLCAKITRKRKVSESLTTRSLDPVRAQRMLQSDFQTLAWLLNNLKKSWVCAISGWILIPIAEASAIMASSEGCFAPSPVQGAQGPQRCRPEDWLVLWMICADRDNFAFLELLRLASVRKYSF